jgi:hypothetical protein
MIKLTFEAPKGTFVPIDQAPTNPALNPRNPRQLKLAKPAACRPGAVPPTENTGDEERNVRQRTDDVAHDAITQITPPKSIVQLANPTSFKPWSYLKELG